MKYFLVEKQQAGCDYTIACGVNVRELEAETEAAARDEVISIMFEKGCTPRWRHRDCGPSEATLLHVARADDLSLLLDANAALLLDANAQRTRAEREETERAEYERLKRKFER